MPNSSSLSVQLSLAESIALEFNEMSSDSLKQASTNDDARRSQINSRAQLLTAYAKGERDFSDLDLSGLDFSETNLVGINFRGANLTESNFSSTILTGAQLNQANCQLANFSCADLTKAKLSETQLDGATLKNAVLLKASLVYAYLAKADLSDANLRAVDAYSADFSRACLKGCDLSFADLTNTSLRYANVRQVILYASNLVNTFFNYSDCAGANFQKSRIRKCSFGHAQLKQANFRQTDIKEQSNVNLSEAVLDAEEDNLKLQLITEWEGKEQSYFDISQTGEKLAYGLNQNTIQVTNLENIDQQLSKAFQIPIESIVSVAFDEKELKFHECFYINSIALWKPGLESKVTEFTQRPGSVSAVVVDSSGQTNLLIENNAIGKSDSSKTVDGKQQCVAASSYSEQRQTLSPNGKLLAEIMEDNPKKTQVTDVETKTLVTIIEHKSAVQSLCFSPDSLRLLCKSKTDTNLWSFEHEKIEYSGHFYTELPPPHPHFMQSSHLLTQHSFIERSVRLATKGRRGVGFSWNERGSSEACSGGDFKISGDRTKIAEKYESHLLQFWDALSGEWLGNITLKHKDERLFALNHSGSQCLTGNRNHFDLWDVASKSIIKTFDNRGSQAFTAIFCEDQQQIIVGSKNGTIRIWGIEDGKEIHTFRSFSDVNTLALSPNGNILLSGNYAQDVCLWNLTSYEECYRFYPYGKEFGHSIVQVAFRQGHNQIFTCDCKGCIRLWAVPDKFVNLMSQS